MIVIGELAGLQPLVHVGGLCTLESYASLTGALSGTTGHPVISVDYLWFSWNGGVGWRATYSAGPVLSQGDTF